MMLMNDADEWCLSKQEPHDRSVLFKLLKCKVAFKNVIFTLKNEGFFHSSLKMSLKNQLYGKIFFSLNCKFLMYYPLHPFIKISFYFFSNN